MSEATTETKPVVKTPTAGRIVQFFHNNTIDTNLKTAANEGAELVPAIVTMPLKGLTAHMTIFPVAAYPIFGFSIPHKTEVKTDETGAVHTAIAYWDYPEIK